MSQDIDPSEFVQRIRQLGEQRDHEDVERVKKLEEDLIQGRSERLARRAERARSISPDKPSTPQSPAGTPRSLQQRAADTPTPAMSPPSQGSARDESLQRLTSASPAPMALDDTEPKKPVTSAAALGRSGTLSWKQRPQSGSLRRPLSMASRSPERPTVTPPTHTPEPSSPEHNPSKSSIAASLGSKDPTWFRQTPDRGIGSAAYRKNQDDSASDAGSISGKRQLPGMSRESTMEPELASPPPESVRSTSPGSRGGSFRGSAMLNNRYSSSIAVGDAEQVARTRSPLPILESQKFAPPSEQGSFDGGDAGSSARGVAMSPTQGRISPERERPASPTKGMGGFVQSAMLKRSDSVNKRWSTQTPPSVTRQNSTLSNRGSAMAGYGTLSRMERPSGLSRDNSMEPSSRPTSSHGGAPDSKPIERPSPTKDEFVKPALPHHSRSKSVASTFSERDQTQEDTSPPSPSKRWSPTKSSWLESALSKPESPKMKQPPPAQPAWMAEINRIKQQRSSADLSKGSPLSSPIKDGLGSGRTSPIKDIQLKPVSQRRPESPMKEEIHRIEEEIPTSKPEVQAISKPEIAPKSSSLEAATPKATREAKASDDVFGEPDIKPTPIPTDTTSSTPSSEKPASQPMKDSSRLAPAIKPKPDTPPKKDFRAGLKSRQPIGDASKKNEVSEFQNVFGKLRKAETKNYVAPDTFKDNINRGKSALNITGGPAPRVRRDEFKESILSKKTAMLEKAKEEGSALKKTDSSSQAAPTPEAIAKRSILNRSESISKPDLARGTREATPEAISRKKSLRTIRPTADSKSAQTPSSTASQASAKPSKLADRFNPALAGMLARGPPPLTSQKSTSSVDDASVPQPRVQDAPSKPGPELQHMTKGRARGPKRRAPATKQTTSGAEQDIEKTAEKVPSKTFTSSTQKPSIDAPKDDAESKLTKNGQVETISIAKTPSRQSTAGKPSTPAKSPRVASGAFAKKPVELPIRSVAPVEATSEKPSQAKPIERQRVVSPTIPKKPASLEQEMSLSESTPIKSPPLKQPESPSIAAKSPPLSASQSRFSRPLPSPPVKPTDSPRSSVLKEISPPNVDMTTPKREQSPEKSSFSSVKNVSAQWGRQSPTTSPAPARTRSPIKLPTKADEQAAMEEAGLVRPDPQESRSLPKPSVSQPLSPSETKPLPAKPKPSGLGFGLGSLGSYLPSRSRESSPAAGSAYPSSPPVSASRPQSEPFKSSPAPEKSDGMFADFFDEAPLTEGNLPEHIDTVHILQSPPLDLGPAGKIRTLRKQIQEMNGDGKMTPLAMQEEHVLYEDAAYICTHVYGDAKGSRQTDVYLWAGNGIAEPTLEDMQLFAKNHAKQNQGRLLIVRQGQELPNFFEALGGIVITRRGSKPGSKEFMLCGRRHLGHLAFDEVDYSLKSLCSAFPYLISTDTGKVYLWKGRGCSAEELSGARLMGMDLAPTGDFSEIDEGAEPQDFIMSFPPSATPTKGPAIPRSADHWRYKSTTEKYRVRLFKMELSSGSGSGWGQALQTPITPKTPSGIKTEIKEIMPFCQRDLEPEHIYVLDAFFEMYIIVGALSRSQAQAFSTALLFAQEYGILAVSEEDRPFMPVTTIVLEGVPRDMKAVFRHWDDRLIPAAGLMSGKLGRGKSLRIMGLEKALEGTRR